MDLILSVFMEKKNLNLSNVKSMEKHLKEAFQKLIHYKNKGVINNNTFKLGNESSIKSLLILIYQQ